VEGGQGLVVDLDGVVVLGGEAEGGVGVDLDLVLAAHPVHLFKFVHLLSVLSLLLLD